MIDFIKRMVFSRNRERERKARLKRPVLSHAASMMRQWLGIKEQVSTRQRPSSLHLDPHWPSFIFSSFFLCVCVCQRHLDRSNKGLQSLTANAGRLIIRIHHSILYKTSSTERFNVEQVDAIGPKSRKITDGLRLRCQRIYEIQVKKAR